MKWSIFCFQSSIMKHFPLVSLYRTPSIGQGSLLETESLGLANEGYISTFDLMSPSDLSDMLRNIKGQHFTHFRLAHLFIPGKPGDTEYCWILKAFHYHTVLIWLKDADGLHNVLRPLCFLLMNPVRQCLWGSGSLSATACRWHSYNLLWAHLWSKYCFKSTALLVEEKQRHSSFYWTQGCEPRARWKSRAEQVYLASLSCLATVRISLAPLLSSKLARSTPSRSARFWTSPEILWAVTPTRWTCSSTSSKFCHTHTQATWTLVTETFRIYL